MKCIQAAGGVEALSMAFYKTPAGGGVWDAWHLESPTMVWYFRGYLMCTGGSTFAVQRRTRPLRDGLLQIVVVGTAVTTVTCARDGLQSERDNVRIEWIDDGA